MFRASVPLLFSGLKFEPVQAAFLEKSRERCYAFWHRQSVDNSGTTHSLDSFMGNELPDGRDRGKEKAKDSFSAPGVPSGSGGTNATLHAGWSQTKSWIPKQLNTLLLASCCIPPHGSVAALWQPQRSSWSPVSYFPSLRHSYSISHWTCKKPPVPASHFWPQQLFMLGYLQIQEAVCLFFTCSASADLARSPKHLSWLLHKYHTYEQPIPAASQEVLILCMGGDPRTPHCFRDDHCPPPCHNAYFATICFSSWVETLSASTRNTNTLPRVSTEQMVGCFTCGRWKMAA